MSIGPFITPEQLARQIHVEQNTVYKYLNDGVIPAMRLGKKWIIRADEIQRMFEEQRHRHDEAD